MTLVWVFGHSIPYGTWLQPGEGWVDRLRQLRKGRGVDDTIRNFAAGGAALHSPGGDPNLIRAQVVEALVQHLEERPDICLIDAGTNDLVTHDNLDPSKYAAIEIDVMLQAVCPERIWMSILPLGLGAAHRDTDLPNLRVRRDNWNAWLLAMRPNFTVADPGWILHPDNTGEPPSWLLLDGLHPSKEGALLVASVMDGVF